MSPIRALQLSLVLLLLAGGVASQCNVTGVNISSYGNPCGPGITPAVLGVQFDAAMCQITLTMTVPPLGIGSFPESHLLGIGSFAVTTPLPFDPTCTVLTNALIVVAQPGGLNVFSFDVPPGLAGVTFYLQGANVWIDINCLCPVLQLTRGMALTFV